MKTLLLSLTTLAFASSSLLAIDQEHKAFTEILAKHVVPTGVKYQALKADHPKLQAYLKELSEVTLLEFQGWKEPEQLSFLINLYNAGTLDLVLKHYPIKSFKDDIHKDGPWKIKSVKAFNYHFTLDQIEHEYLRKVYKEPRIHFAVNCASAGCPPLRAEAFTGSKLETQLEEQTVAFLASDKNKLSGSNLALSPIFDWFKEDFIKQSGSVEAFVAPYFKEKKITPGKMKITFTEYGWSLNEGK